MGTGKIVLLGKRKEGERALRFPGKFQFAASGVTYYSTRVHGTIITAVVTTGTFRVIVKSAAAVVTQSPSSLLLQ